MTTLTSGDARRPHCSTSVRATFAASTTSFLRQDALIETLDLRRVLDARFHAGHVGGKAAYLAGIPGQMLHLGSEVLGVSHSEQEPILAVFHQFRHPTDIGCYHGNAEEERLLRREREALNADRRNDQHIHPTECLGLLRIRDLPHEADLSVARSGDVLARRRAI